MIRPRSASSLCVQMSFQTLTTIAINTCRQYHRRECPVLSCSFRSPITTSLLGLHPKFFKSHCANPGGCIDLMPCLLPTPAIPATASPMTVVSLLLPSTLWRLRGNTSSPVLHAPALVLPIGN